MNFLDVSVGGKNETRPSIKFQISIKGMEVTADNWIIGLLS